MIVASGITGSDVVSSIRSAVRISGLGSGSRQVEDSGMTIEEESPVGTSRIMYQCL